jgi:hypothetical protein
MIALESAEAQVIWSVHSLALAYQVASAVWRLAGPLPSTTVTTADRPYSLHLYVLLQNKNLHRLWRQPTAGRQLLQAGNWYCKY